jgi:ATP/maltotriose-dependent transcriptional regulator MalT
MERRAWQLGAATREPDESVASALQAAASEARSRSGYAPAAAALERAARLTPQVEQRIARLVESARDWHLAGRTDAAAGLLDEALSLTRDLPTRAAIQHLRGRIDMSRGRFAGASALLAVEAAAIAEQDPRNAAFMLMDAAVAASTAGAVGTSVEHARRAWQLAEPLGGPVADAARAVLGGELEMHGEPQSEDERASVVEAVSSLAALRPLPPIAAMAPVVLTVLEEYDRARLLLDRFHDDARAMGAPTILVPVLCLRSDVAFRTGDWIPAYADAAESLRLARETGQLVFHSLAFLARVEAARGLEADCRAHAEEALEHAERDGVGAATTYARWALGLLALGLGRMSEAIEQLEEVARLVDEHEMRQPLEVPWAQDLVEAYARSGSRVDASRVLARLQAQAESTRLSSALAAASRCRGLLADDSGFATAFEEALVFHERTRTPFERARTELCFGEVLRRSRRRSDARRHLRAALDTFERLDAAPWAARARAELAAAGEVASPRDEEWTRLLTPQELQLSMIVGRGATNKEAAAALFISPKTVEAHLHRIYVKLGIRSRTELAGLLARAHMLGD